MQQPERFSVILVSGDAAFREDMRARLATIPFLTEVAEIGAPLGQLDAAHREELKLAGPGYLMVDLDGAREASMRFIAEVAERRPELKVVAFSEDVSTTTLLEAIRSGAAEFIHKPVDEKVLMDALLRIRKQFVPRGEVVKKSAGEVLTFFSTKGGSGATTVACNAAISLAKSGRHSVLLVDLDLQLGELALFLGMKPKYTIMDLLSNLHRADEALLKTFVMKHESGVHLLAGPDSPETEGVVGGEQIKRALGFLRAHYDFVIVDMPNNYYDYVVATLDQANRMFIVCTADLPSLKNIQRSLAIFEKLGFAKNRMHVVLNRYDKNDQASVDRGAIERLLGGKIFWSIPNDYPTVIRAINSGIPLASTNHTEIAKSFAGLAEQIGGGTVHAATNGNGKGNGAGREAEKGRKMPFAFLKK